jgi:hypothetical protein
MPEAAMNHGIETRARPSGVALSMWRALYSARSNGDESSRFLRGGAVHGVGQTRTPRRTSRFTAIASGVVRTAHVSV